MVTVGVFALIIIVLVLLVSGTGRNASQDVIRVVEKVQDNIGLR